MASVLVFGEADGGALTATTRELLGAATRLGASLGGGVSCALLGRGLTDAAQQAVAAGADTVYVADDAALAQYQTDTYGPLAAEIATKDGANVVLMGQTSMGRDLAPRLATRLESAVVVDAVDLTVDGGRVRATRSCYGGNARQVVAIQTDPQVITVRAKSQEPLPEDSSRSGQIETLDSAVPAPRAKVVQKDLAEAEGVKLTDAEIVISGGRGLGGPENFADLERVAGIVRAAVGASRAACDLGWYPPSQQVGLTGSVVSPTLYLAIAISGASQHMAGCSGAKNIVAINKDPDANIFRFCRYGIVDDYKKVLPALEKALAEAVEGR